MDEKALNLLGLAFKARKIVCGEDSVIKELQSKKAKVVFVASDSSDKTIENFKRKCYFYKVPCYTCFTCEQITSSIGKYNHIIAINDDGFYKALQKYLG